MRVSAHGPENEQLSAFGDLVVEDGFLRVGLARQEYPDTSAYNDPEIVWRMQKRHHVGFVVAAKDPERVKFLLDDYARRFANDFLAVLPPNVTRPPSIQP